MILLLDRALSSFSEGLCWCEVVDTPLSGGPGGGGVLFSPRSDADDILNDDPYHILRAEFA